MSALNAGEMPPPDDLILPAAEIIDRNALLARLDQSAGQSPEAQRAQLLEDLREAQRIGRARIAAAFLAQPFAAKPATRAYAWLTDELVRTALHYAMLRCHPVDLPTAGEKLAVIAVGGYGRGEMAPFSDVDLLFLTPYKITPWAESLIETVLYLLWDLRLKVGHASRSIADCLRLARDDMTIRTAMLEQRFLVGDYALAAELTQRLQSELFATTARDFVEAKLSERETRHQKQFQRYVVEPNVKEGKGGLRDLQSLFWIGKYVHGVKDPADLVCAGLLRPEELEAFERAENFLWAVRCHMHLITKRATEQLTFDVQVDVADAMGYEERAGRRGVEWFMQDYFLQATEVGDLTRIVLTKLEAQHAKAAPLLQRLFKRTPEVGGDYAVVHGRLAVADPETFLKDRLNLLRLFQEGLRTGLLIHPDAMRLAKSNLDLIDADMRNDPAARALFLDLLLEHGNPERALRRMNELGVLSAFIPEFESIVAMMQFNMYHSYTVDEHTIQCIAQLAQIERGELVEDLPVASGILQDGVNRRILYVALLLHDIGKGRPEDHSILGARIARVVAPRMGLDAQESETVEWLVRFHLLMSDTAQKRDIADPRTVDGFAKMVKTRERLDLLCVLTVCDIRGVGPEVWNNWKAVLIRALYRQTRRALEGGIEALSRELRGEEAKALLRERLSDWSEKDIRTELDRHYDPYWQGLHVTAHEVFARLLRTMGENEIAVDLHPDDARDATRACCVMPDHPGIFARLTGALALVGANIVDARSYSTKDGFVTDAFWIQDMEERPFEASRLPRLKGMIERILGGDVIAREAFRDRDKVKKREKPFSIPTHVTFDNDGSEIYTVIEVDTRDRPGLLYDLTRTLAEANVYIANAVIATYGERAVDTFYVKDMFGLKYHSAAKQKSLEKRLRAAITAGQERASD